MFRLSTKTLCVGLLALLPMTSFAGEVSLSGSASVSYAPDSVRMQLTASAEEATPRAAVQKVNKTLEQWRERIEPFRQSLNDYSDASLSQYTRSLPSPDREQKPVSRSVARQTISFSMNDLSLLNSVIEQIQALGLEYRLGPDQFFHSRESEFRRQALAGAIEDAKARCEFVARQLDQRCGDVVSISVGDHHQPRPMMAEMRASSGAVDSVGPREVEVSVNATFELE